MAEMKFSVGYFFTIGNTSYGGTEDVEAAADDKRITTGRSLIVVKWFIAKFSR